MVEFGGPGQQLDRIENIIKKADCLAKIALVVSIFAFGAAIIGLIPIVREFFK